MNSPQHVWNICLLGSLHMSENVNSWMFFGELVSWFLTGTTVVHTEFIKRNTRNSLYCILHIIASLIMFQLTSRWSKLPVWHSPDSCKPSSRQNPADHLPPARSAPWTSHVPCIVHGEEAFSTCLTWLCSPRIWFWCLGTLSHQRPHHHSEE